MVKRPPVTAGLGMKRATPSSFRIALFSVSRCSGVIPGKMSTPWRVWIVGSVGAWNDDLCRLLIGEEERLVGEGERRRFEGGGVEAVMDTGGVGCDSVVVGPVSLSRRVFFASRSACRYFCRCGVSSMALQVHMCRAVLLRMRDSCSSVSCRVCHPVGVEGMA